MYCTRIKIEKHDCNKEYEFQVCDNCGEIVRNHDGRVIWNFIAEYGLKLEKRNSSN